MYLTLEEIFAEDSAWYERKVFPASKPVDLDVLTEIIPGAELVVLRSCTKSGLPTAVAVTYTRHGETLSLAVWSGCMLLHEERHDVYGVYSEEALPLGYEVRK